MSVVSPRRAPGEAAPLAPRDPPSRLAWDAALLLAAVILGIGVLASLRDVPHDVALHLDLGARILAGDRPYVDYVELNPPLVHYLHVIPALVAELSGVHPYVVANLLVLLGVLVSAGTIRGLGRRAGRPTLGAALACSVVLAALLVRGADAWGQREHLFALAASPMFVARILDVRPRRGGALAMGLAAGLGACLKPHFVAIMAVSEALWALRRRPVLDPMLLGWVVAGFAYAIHFFFWPPEMRHALFQVWIPVVRELYDAGYGRSLDDVLDRWGSTLIVLGGLAVLGPLVSRRALDRILPVAAATGVAIAVFLIQGKGFPYHVVPAIHLALLTIVTGIGFSAWPRRLGLWVALTSPLWLWYATSMAPSEVPPSEQLAREVQRVAPEARTFLAISSRVDAAYPWIGRHGGRHVGRHPVAFGAAVLPSGDSTAVSPGPLREAVGILATHLREDLERRPQVLIIETTCRYCAPGRSIARFLDEAGLWAPVERDWVPVTTTWGHTLYIPRPALPPTTREVPGAAPGRGSSRSDVDGPPR